MLALTLFGVGYAVIAPSAERAEAQTLAAEAAAGEQPTAEDVAQGREIWTKSCASCHGPDGTGGEGYTGPDITGEGGAAVDFQVSTGRMPSTNPDAQMPRKPPVYDQEAIDDLVAYYEAQIGEAGAPEVPSADIPGSAPVRNNFADEAAYEQALEEWESKYEQYLEGAQSTDAGMQLYLANCAHCHSWSGEGGALTGGRWAPEIGDASPRQIYEAMITGPGAMPVFNDTTVTPDEKQELIAYVKDLQAEPNAGGIFDLNRIGQVAEGFIAWTVGLSLIVACAIWITAKQRAHD
ncbi:Menaquinol-cytochrome c reductase cytochrome c subunit [Streptomonospora litoralis]|uniref:Menaquinol-cytochrome c reductase cytochrome c subunit n=2 Tax=Streptomonospora litoralis TaxID=2498135 RepID=A0A4P6PZN5_9ACTN|nr:Menaquinol-cytochrome c reductase cytochrome c subunit [Streptomonospora litoralis]